MKNLLKIIIIYILHIEAQLVLYKYKPKIIAITGSVGKTSTKDAAYAVMSKFYNVRRSQKSFNSEIGLPLTILGCPTGWTSPKIWSQNILTGLKLIILPNQYPEWLILEVGVGKKGDMHRTTSWLKTDAVIVTAIGATPVHIEFFDSRKQLIDEKSQLIQTLKQGGVLILNADDEDVFAMKSKTRQLTTTYGFKDGADLLASADSVLYDEQGLPKGVIFRIDENGNSLPVSIEGVFGRNHMYASLGALALAFGLKLDVLTAINALQNYDVPPGRMRLLKGINGSFIIDDTYNSSPLACEAALKTLSEIKSENNNYRKIAILGDMLELGRHTFEAHKNIGKLTVGVVDILMVVGSRAKIIKEGAMEVGMNEENIFEFNDSREAGAFIKTLAQKDDIILVKGSQGARMEHIVEKILLDQENKNKLLVRQDAEWQKR